MYYLFVLQLIYLNKNYDMIVVWRKANAAQLSWTQVQLTLPVGVSVINIDAVSGIESQAVNYIAVDDVTITSGQCPQPG